MAVEKGTGVRADAPITRVRLGSQRSFINFFRQISGFETVRPRPPVLSWFGSPLTLPVI